MHRRRARVRRPRSRRRRGHRARVVAGRHEDRVRQLGHHPDGHFDRRQRSLGGHTPGRDPSWSPDGDADRVRERRLDPHLHRRVLLRTTPRSSELPAAGLVTRRRRRSPFRSGRRHTQIFVIPSGGGTATQVTPSSTRRRDRAELVARQRQHRLRGRRHRASRRSRGRRRQLGTPVAAGRRRRAMRRRTGRRLRRSTSRRRRSPAASRRRRASFSRRPTARGAARTPAASPTRGSAATRAATTARRSAARPRRRTPSSRRTSGTR